MIFSSSDSARDWVLGYGVYAPLALFLLQIAQVIIAPLNNFIINLAGGYIFGPYFGFLYNYFGWVSGAIIVFFLARRVGRKFVDFFVSQEKLAKFDQAVEKGSYFIFALFLMPGIPDDFLVYLVALSKKISFKTFLWMIMIGKIPGKLATSFLGAGIAEKDIVSILIFVVFSIVSVVIFYKKPELWHIGRGDLRE